MIEQRHMSRTLDITEGTFSRLEKLAVGFDSPEAVIIRLLDGIEGKKDVKPTINFWPSDEKEFKLKLIEAKEAEAVIFKSDNSREITHWNARRFTESSNLRANLWSGLLRDWKTKGIEKVELSILPRGKNHPDDDTEQRKVLALEFDLTFDEISELDYEINTNMSEDDLQYNYIIQFYEGCDKEILAKIDGLDENLWINVDNSVLN